MEIKKSIHLQEDGYDADRHPVYQHLRRLLPVE